MTTPHELPRHTTPTWEMELLISGATVFALLQLPGVLDELFFEYFPRFAKPLAEFVLLPYLYGKTAVYALILTFVLHLAARGYWVALVGLRSVYRDGVRWDRLKWGPNYRRALKDATLPADELIERADNRASLVFGYGIGFAFITLTPLLLLALVAAATMLLQFATAHRLPWEKVWTAMLVASFAPILLAILLDRVLGAKLPPDGVIARVLRGYFGAYRRIGMTSNYPMLMFLSRAGQRRGGVLLALGLMGMIAITLVQFMAREGELDVGSYGALALGEPGSLRAIRNEHYADLREGAQLASTAPFIPALVVRGDWLKLFVPYRPGRDTAALERDCAAAPPIDDATLHPTDAARLQADAARARVLDCLPALYAPTLDGELLPDLRFDAADDPASGLRGVLAMIPIRDLAPGRHELVVRRLRSPQAEADEPDPAPHRIVFWR